MNLKKSILALIFVSWAVFFQFSSLTYANLCPTTTPRESKVWIDFDKVFQSEYYEKGLKRADFITRWKFIGHALGRLALAVQGQPDRRAAFDCVQLALAQFSEERGIAYGYFPSAIYRQIMMAAMGMFNEELKDTFQGDLPTEPLYVVFGGKINNPIPLKDSAGTGGGGGSAKIKKDPVAVGGGVPSGGSPGGGKAGPKSSGRCSNWMQLNFADRKGNNLSQDTEKACTLTGKSGDFITSFNPVSKVCFVCSKDDWTPSLPPPPPPPGGSGPGGHVAGGRRGSGGGFSDTRNCQLDSGYIFSAKRAREFNVLKEKKPYRSGSPKFYYTIGNQPFRSTSSNSGIIRARKEAERIEREGGKDGRQYEFVFRGDLNGFCNFIESQCDLKGLSMANIVVSVGNYCGWTK